MLLQGRHIVLGVTGSIAAYRAADLASKLVQAGALVDVIMTPEAQKFVAPLTFGSLTGRPVFTDMFQPASGMQEEHVALARRADLVLIAPATATALARLAYGLADDFVALTALATKAPILVAPAMDSQMWEAAATVANVALLKERGVTFIGPASGRLASGNVGAGRLAEVEEIVGFVKLTLAKTGDLAGVRIVVSAGGTREPIDPVRFIGNHSSGKMGYAVAEAARDRGADVTLVSTTTALATPTGVSQVNVSSVAEMRDAVLRACDQADVLVMAAAVSDFRPADVGAQKIKKGEGELVLQLVQNDDFFLEVPDSVIKVGFAAETQDLLDNAAKKLAAKRLDLNVANDVTAAGAGFGVDTNKVTIVDRAGGREDVPLMAKYEVAHRILDRVVPLLRGRR